MDVDSLSASMRNVSISDRNRTRKFQDPISKEDSTSSLLSSDGDVTMGETTSAIQTTGQLDNLSRNYGTKLSARFPATHSRMDSSSSDKAFSTHTDGTTLRREGTPATVFSGEVSATLRGLLGPILLYVLGDCEADCELARRILRFISFAICTVSIVFQLKALSMLMVCRLFKRSCTAAESRSPGKMLRCSEARTFVGLGIPNAYWKIATVENVVLRVLLWVVLVFAKVAVLLVCGVMIAFSINSAVGT